MRFTGFNGEGQRFGIHIAMHQQFAGINVRRYGWNEAMRIKFWRQLTAFLNLLNRFARPENCLWIHFVLFSASISRHQARLKLSLFGVFRPCCNLLL